MADAANALAWMLASNPDATRRRPDEAIKLAEQACELSHRRDDSYLDTLAVAYAAAGRFDEAKKTIQEAIRVATTGPKRDMPNITAPYQSRLALFEAGKAYVEP